MDLAERIRLKLRDGSSMTYADMVHEFDCTDRHVRRAIQKLREQGDVVADQDGRRQAWRLAVRAEAQTITVTASQAFSLYTWRCLFDQLAGTHFADDIRDLSMELQRSFQTKEIAAIRRLDRKFYERPESRIEMNDMQIDPRDLIGALLEEERINVRHDSVKHSEVEFTLEPLTLMAYKRMLYIVGHSAFHERVRTFALTGFTAAQRCEGDRFQYPDNYHPQDHAESGFGIFQERELVHVRIWISEKKERIVRRRKWHASQTVERGTSSNGRPGVIVSLDVVGTTELDSWVLGWGEHAEVLDPPSFRHEIKEAIARSLSIYAGPTK